MSTNTDEDEEYLDDPISLMTFHDIVNTCDIDEIIDLEASSDEESKYTSSYGKRDFLLPVTFFDISRNVRLLNKCKPMSINIVDCKQYPNYYTKCVHEKDKNKSDDSRVEVERNSASESENKANNTIAEDTPIGSGKTDDDDTKRKTQRKGNRAPRGNSFYEKLKYRKENKKQVALNCKDLTKVDFKRNKGLVGLKITGIFKQIVDTEQALTRTKSVEHGNKNCIENKSKEKSISNTDKIVIATKSNPAEDKSKEKSTCNVEKTAIISKNNSYGDKTKEQRQNGIEKTLIATKNFAENKYKEKSEGVLFRKESKTVENKTKDKNHCDAEKLSIKIKNNSLEDVSKEKYESSSFIKNIGTALDTVGTSITPIENINTNNGSPKIVNLDAGNIYDSIKKSHDCANVKDSLENTNDNNQMRCSLKIPTKKIIEKALKLKQAKHTNNNLNVAVELNPNGIAKDKDNRKPPKHNFKHINHDINDFYIALGKYKLKMKSPKKRKVRTSKETSQVDKTVIKGTNTNDQAGPNSPVIPCTTITIRAGPLKSSQNIPDPKNTANTEKQAGATISNNTPKSRQKNPPTNNTTKCSGNNMQKSLPIQNSNTLTNHVDLTKSSNCTVASRHNEVTVSQANIAKGSSMSYQSSTSTFNTFKIFEYKFPNKKPVITCLSDSVSLSDPNLTKNILTKGANPVNTLMNPAENVARVGNQMINGLITNQCNQSPQMNNPAFNKSMYQNHLPNNAIILRKPPPPQHFQSNVRPNQGQPIQTVINNRPQYQPMPNGVRPIRFQAPPPPYPTQNPNIPTNFAPVRPKNQNILPQCRMPSHFRGMDMGLNYWRSRFLGYPCPPPPPPPPPPQDSFKNNLGPPVIPQTSKDSIIGSTTNGEPIKKINIVAMPANTVDDKEMMLAELNNAIMSPELIAEKPEDVQANNLKRKADNIPPEPIKPKCSKPCPLSKKNNGAADLNVVNNPEKPPPKVGYSPPILPILTYEETFEILSQNDQNVKKAALTQNRTPSKLNMFAVGITKPDKAKRKISSTENEKQDKAKKISFDDYRKRVTKYGVDRIDVNKIRKYNESKKIADDCNQDLGYASDSTVKL